MRKPPPCMRFLLDQSSDARIIACLNAQGHDTTRIAKDCPAELPDPRARARLPPAGRRAKGMESSGKNTDPQTKALASENARHLRSIQTS